MALRCDGENIPLGLLYKMEIPGKRAYKKNAKFSKTFKSFLKFYGVVRGGREEWPPLADMISSLIDGHHPVT